MNRRQFLGSMFAGAGAFTLNPSTLGAALAALPQGAFAPAGQSGGRDPVIHVINRLTYGVTPELVAHVRQIGVQAFIEEQLNPEVLTDTDLQAVLQPLMPMLEANGGVLRMELENRRAEVFATLVGAMLARSVGSRRQLFERVVQFWGDHFSVFIGKGPVLFLKIDHDRDAIRPKALGQFRELLGVSSRSPAILIYLDNAQSERRAPNENFSRELLELHTLGVNGGYTEDDVKEVARAFTGWSVNGRQENPDGRIEFTFRRMFHDPDEKVVLGTVIPAGGGELDGETVLDLLAEHPSTARLIASKLARRFVADQPPAELVETVAAEFTRTNGDIRAALRALFTSESFWNAPPKFKQPYEYAISLVRALNYRVTAPLETARALQEPLDALGQVPFTWPAPNGFPDVMGAWMNGLIMRWNMAVGAAGGEIAGMESGVDGLLTMFQANDVPFETEPVLDHMGGYLFGRTLTAQERGIVLDFATSAAQDPAAQIRAGLALLLASPAFQYR
ncbi:MAG: DUF1800 domain-containing protein [bacterium]|nr:DUF1800 domain-containing protein [bacterium]